MDAEGNSTPTRRGLCRFDLGTAEQHQVEIRLDKTIRVNAYVDGELVEYDLFSARARRHLRPGCRLCCRRVFEQFDPLHQIFRCMIPTAACRTRSLASISVN